MLDQPAAVPTGPRAQDVARYDLVVVGAGIAGLNTLFAAKDYLPRGARVLLIDHKAQAGGMWNTAYDYVRLDQPHPMFTVGDLPWDWSRPKDYLASRDEVRDHLARALDPVAQAVSLDIRFGQTVTDCTEVESPSGPCARVTFHPNDAPGQVTSVEASRAFHAAGLNYQTASALDLTSDRVLSIIPQDLLATLAAHPQAPVIVVGGGKTGMDTVLEVLSAEPARPVSLISGRGTNFINRSFYMPKGLKRWTSGALISSMLRDMAVSFDGDNEAAVIDRFRQRHATDPGADNRAFLWGMQSEDELARITSGLAATWADYLDDVSDTPDGPVMTLRSGARQPIAPGSIVVNCTGSFFRTAQMVPKHPLLSPRDTVVRISPRDGFHFQSSVASFFVAHLVYRGALRGKGYYTLDHEALFRADRTAWAGASAAHGYMNQLISLKTLPLSVLDHCGLDLDRWYPLPRRLAGFVRMKMNSRADIDRCRATLDRVAERFGVTCGPLA
ncbi:MAG: hypothetical protein CML68_18920 [Rhodobacteraceae bacterium]|nr:hypothetical protein [Paracoccaceae bacterium]